MISMLTRTAFMAARRFIETTARPLEIARFHFHFHASSANAVLEALGAYQNADGGFGHGLEPDLRTEHSSALCTSVAFQILRSIKASSHDVRVSNGLAYLLKTLNKNNWHWRIIPPQAAQHPHAPWWDQTDREEMLDAFSLNPTAEILGYLYDHQPLAPGDILSKLTERVVAQLSDLKHIDMHDLLCCLRLLSTNTLPDDTRDQMGRVLAQHIQGAVACDPAQWKGYSLRPLQVVKDPSSPFMPGLEGAVEANLDYEIASQNSDGSWLPTWSWGETYPDVWAKARSEWAGCLTLENLLILKRFERIEGIG